MENLTTRNISPQPKVQVSLRNPNCLKCCVDCPDSPGRKRSKVLEKALKEIYQKTLEVIVGNKDPMKTIGEIRSKAFCAIHNIEEAKQSLLDKIIETTQNPYKDTNDIVLILMSKETLEWLENDCRNKCLFVEEKKLHEKIFVYGVEITIFDRQCCAYVAFCHQLPPPVKALYFSYSSST